MSFQMSRVRGAGVYRLVVTRATNIERICGWLGVDRTLLKAINPDLQSDELQEGEELVVLASYVHLDVGREDNVQSETALPRAEEISQEAEGAAEFEAPEEEEESVETSEDEGPSDASESVAYEAADEVQSTPQVQQENEGPDDGAPGVEEEKVAVEPQPPAPSKVTWKPFPKSDL